MSGPEKHIFTLLTKMFPYMKILNEYFVRYKGNNLYVDFYIPQLSLVIEVQGRQHREFVKHFHGDFYGWKRYKELDYLKAEWALNKNLYFLELFDNQLPSSVEELRSYITKVMS